VLVEPNLCVLKTESLPAPNNVMWLVFEIKSVCICVFELLSEIISR
jgi:hypothetical protein